MDNGSRPEIAARLEAALPGCRLLRNAVNLGFAGGYNRGMRQARGEYVAVLNNDAVADARWIEELVRTAARDPRAGAVATVVIDGRHPDRLDSCGLGMALDGMSRQIGTGRPGRRQAARAGGPGRERLRLPVPQGGPRPRRLFDESFFAYCEDADLGLRLRWAGSGRSWPRMPRSGTASRRQRGASAHARSSGWSATTSGWPSRASGAPAPPAPRRHTVAVGVQAGACCAPAARRRSTLPTSAHVHSRPPRCGRSRRPLRACRRCSAAGAR